MSTEKFANAFQTILSAAITSTGATSLTVTSATGAPAPQFRILVDLEIMIVTAISGTTCTVLRGQEGTTAATHANGATVTHVLTSGSLDQRLADEMQAGVVSSLPAAEKAGRIYRATDYPVAFRDNGTTWDMFGPIYPLKKPALSGFTGVNLGSTTVADVGCGIVMATAFTGGGGARMELQARAGTNYTITMGCLPCIPPAGSYPRIGLCVRDSATGHMIEYVYLFRTGALNGSPANCFYLQGSTFSDPTTSVADLFGLQWQPAGGMVWLRIWSDGSQRRFLISTDGVNFTQFFTHGNTTYITEDQVGFLVDAGDINETVLLTVLHWTNTSP